jgi:ferrous iron transport protein B
MGVLYHSKPAHGNDTKESLSNILRNDRYKEGPKIGVNVFTPLVGISFLLFILIYMPCVAVVATVTKESGSWKWALFLISYTTILAWVVSFTVYQVGGMF